MNTRENAATCVLLVDDDIRLLNLLQQVLSSARNLGSQTVTAQSVEAALQRIAEGGIDVILLDLSLPDSDGYETFRRIHAAAPDIPIVVLSGWNDEALAIRMVHDGAEDYLLKGDLQIGNVARALRYAIERKHAQRAIQAERTLLRNVLNSLPDGVFVKDTDNRYIVANAAHARFLDVGGEASVIGRTVDHFVPAAIAEKIVAEDEEVIRSGEPLLDRLEPTDTGWRLLSKVPLRDEQGSIIGMVGISRDVTEQKRIEERLRESKEELRSFAASLQDDREEFRRVLSRELHDEIGQALTALRIELVRMVKNPPDSSAVVSEKAAAMSDLVNSCIDSVRHICSKLRPRILDDLGLVAALEWQTKEFQRRTEIECDFSAPPALDLDADRSTALFRVAQEALTNVVRYACASRVELKLRPIGSGVEMELRDNGRGITSQETKRSGSLGLFGMRERVKCFGGEFEISGVPGEGTTVRVRLP